MGQEKNVFLTGGTGLLGSFLARELLDRGYTVFALARSRPGRTAQARVREALKFVYDDAWSESLFSSRVRVVEGDISEPGLGLSQTGQEALEPQVDLIVHSAAIAELRAPLANVRAVNVEGTRRVLDFALRCQKNGRLRKVNHISTMYVVGTKAGAFDRTMLDVGQGFHNTYEQSKFEAEILVRTYIQQGLDVSVFRPSMIMGDSRTGKTNNFRLFYQPLHYFSRGLFETYPADPACSQNLINIDTVAVAITLLVEAAGPRVYHLINPEETNVEQLVKLAARRFGFKMPRFLPSRDFDFRGLTPAQRALCSDHVPYFNYQARFVLDDTYPILKKSGFTPPRVDEANLLRVLNYCVAAGFVSP